MAKPKVLATRPLFPAAQDILNAACEAEYWTNPERISKEELFRRIKDKEGLVCLLTEKVDLELLSAAPKLRIAANVAVGFDNIDVAACTKRGVVATNTPGVLDETTADFAWTLLMAVATAADRRRHPGAVREVERLGPGSTRGDGRVGQDARDCGIRENWKSDGAPRARFSDESDLCGCGARTEAVEKELNAKYRRDGELAGGVRFCERPCAALAGDARAV